MPNHVTTVLHAPPHVIHGLMTEEGVDFNRVIPAPESYFDGGCNGKHPHVVDGVTYEHCWYDWNRTHWGTKWNAYSQDTDQVNEGRVKFETAWSHPFSVIKALSEKFPEAEIRVQYADEDLGSNCGEYLIEAGVVTQELEFGSMAEQCDFAAQLNYGKSYAELQKEWGDD